MRRNKELVSCLGVGSMIMLEPHFTMPKHFEGSGSLGKRRRARADLDLALSHVIPISLNFFFTAWNHAWLFRNRYVLLQAGGYVRNSMAVLVLVPVYDIAIQCLESGRTSNTIILIRRSLYCIVAI